MRKSTIFISAALTTFALVILYGLVSAYRGAVNVPEATAQPVDTATAEPTSVVDPTPTAVTPEQAAQFAAQVLGHNDLQSAESANLNGVNAYKITFISGDVVYVGLDGQILAVQAVPQVVTVVQQQPARKHKDSGGGGGGGNGGGGEHDGGGD